MIDVGTRCKLLSTQTGLGVASGKYQQSRCYLLRTSGVVQEITVSVINTPKNIGK